MQSAFGEQFGRGGGHWVTALYMNPFPLNKSAFTTGSMADLEDELANIAD